MFQTALLNQAALILFTEGGHTRVCVGSHFVPYIQQLVHLDAGPGSKLMEKPCVKYLMHILVQDFPFDFFH